MRRRERLLIWLWENELLPIDLFWFLRWGTTVAMVVFFVLWRWAEWNQNTAVDLAYVSTEATATCLADYSASAAKMNEAVDALTLQLRTE